MSIRPILVFRFFIILWFCNTTPSIGQKISSENLLAHLEFLASDELEGRKTLEAGNLKARQYIQNFLNKLEHAESIYPDYTHYFSFENSRTKKRYDDAANLIAYIPGSESKKIIVITAHYDHVGVGRANASGDSIYNGADDNASGTAALLEIASYFSKNRPKHAIMIAALDAEEMGLQGAKALVNDFPYELDQILLNINMDMIGRNDQNELYVSGTHYYPQFKDILETTAQNHSINLRFGHDIPGTGADDWTKSSDHGAFFAKQVPHLYFGVEDHEDYHKPSDGISGIQADFFTHATNLILDCILAIDKKIEIK